MGETFYHVDRRDELTPGETVDLRDVEAVEGGAAGLAALYPDGLTHHGRYYCSQDLYGDRDDLWDISCEVIFELVRTALFPDKPSRFQSVYGFRALRDAERFVDGFVDGPYAIREVTATESFTADMHLVDAETVDHGVEQAYDYWRGETRADRPLWEELLVPPVAVGETVRDCDG